MCGNVQVINMNSDNKISLCQPGNGKGCCVCCGLFNLKNISYKELSYFLNDATDELSSCKGKNKNTRNFKNLQTRYAFRDATTYVCPYMGYVDGTTPGCLMHPSVNKGVDNRDCSLFGKEICNDYFCPAYRLLDERLQKILIAYTYDWYTYSIGIIDPVSFIWIVQMIEEVSGKLIAPENNNRDTNVAQLVNSSLLVLAQFFNQLPVTVFYYSEPEYYMYMRSLSLDTTTSYNAVVKDAIAKIINAGINGCYS